jgi:hypothetical protein
VRHYADLPKSNDGVEHSTIFVIVEGHFFISLCIRKACCVQSPKSHPPAGNQRWQYHKRKRLHQEPFGMNKNQFPEQHP